jgi:hypothetical protein
VVKDSIDVLGLLHKRGVEGGRRFPAGGAGRAGASDHGGRGHRAGGCWLWSAGARATDPPQRLPAPAMGYPVALGAHSQAP